MRPGTTALSRMATGSRRASNSGSKPSRWDRSLLRRRSAFRLTLVSVNSNVVLACSASLIVIKHQPAPGRDPTDSVSPIRARRASAKANIDGSSLRCPEKGAAMSHHTLKKVIGGVLLSGTVAMTDWG
jgi:hypothetical protein